MAMVGEPGRRHRSIVVGWHCALCIKNLGDAVLEIPRHPKVVFYQRESDFYDHFDRTCHICQTEFTCKVASQEHKKSVHAGNAGLFESKCSLCGSTFKKKEDFEYHKKRHTPFRCAAGKSCIGMGWETNMFIKLDRYKNHVKECDGYQAQFFWSATVTEVRCFACQALSIDVPSLYEHFRNCDMAIHYDLNRITSTQMTRETLIPHIKSHHPETQIHSVDLATVPRRKEVIIHRAPEMIIHCPDEATNNCAKKQPSPAPAVAVSKPLNGFQGTMLPPKKRHLAEEEDNTDDVMVVVKEEPKPKPALLPQLLGRLEGTPQWLNNDPKYLSLLMKPLKVKVARGGWKKTDVLKLTPAQLPKKNQRIVLDGYRPPRQLRNDILDKSLDNVKRELKRNLNNMEVRMKREPVAQFPNDPDLHGFEENGVAWHFEPGMDESVQVLDDSGDELEVIFEGQKGTEGFDRVLNIDGTDDSVWDDPVPKELALHGFRDDRQPHHSIADVLKEVQTGVTLFDPVLNMDGLSAELPGSISGRLGCRRTALSESGQVINSNEDLTLGQKGTESSRQIVNIDRTHNNVLDELNPEEHKFHMFGKDIQPHHSIKDDLKEVKTGNKKFDPVVNMDGLDTESPDSISKDKTHFSQHWHRTRCQEELKEEKRVGNNTFNLQLNLDGQLDDLEDEYTPGQPIKTEMGEARPEQQPSTGGDDPLDSMEFEMTSETAETAQVCDDE